MRQNELNNQRLNIIRLGGVLLAALGIVLSIVGAAADLDRFFHIYLVAYLFWFEITLGCLALLMLHFLINARWSLVLQRFALAGARTMPLLALFFLPVVLGMERVYPWVSDGADHPYNNVLFFLVRAVIYFLIWIALSTVLANWSLKYEETGDPNLMRRVQRLSVVGLMLYFFTGTFAAFDWVMSIDPDWFSSIFGWLSMSGGGLATLSFLLIILAVFWQRKPLHQLVTNRVIGDLGALLLVALLLWIYLHFIQYVVIWSANVSAKAPWYVDRTAGSWQGFAVLLVILHAIPLIALLLPGVKKMRWGVAVIAGILLVLRLFELFWTVMPAFIPEFGLQWWDLALPIALGGIWIAVFAWLLLRQPLVPVNHPDTLAVTASQEDELYETA